MIVTWNRPALLARCLRHVLAQAPPPDDVLVVDNASGPETATVLAGFPTVRVLRLPCNEGGAAGFHAGLQSVMATDAAWFWVMDDDGHPGHPECLPTLLRGAAQAGADLVGPLVLDIDQPARLAFPIRIAGRTRFGVAELREHGPVHGFAHLFNGALVGRGLIERIGLPDPRLFIRGDEVEFLLRARRAGARILLDTAAAFMHPGSAPEIHPIFGGLFYAVVPDTGFKRFYQFRNRGYIFRRYGMWGWLLADVIRYGYFFLVTRRGDVAGLRAWAAAMATGVWRGIGDGTGPPLTLARSARLPSGR